MSTVEQSTALTVVDRLTGEILDVKAETTERLARFHTEADALKGEIADMQTIVNHELVDRLDKSAKWTRRVGDQGVAQWEIKAPSPAAGTEDYPPSDLERELRGLVSDDVITEDAAAGALKRTVTIEVTAPLGVDLEQIVDLVKASAETEIAGLPVRVVAATAHRSAVKAGIAALRKVPGTGEALDRAKVILPAAPRRAKVTLKTKADA